jgi:hypothetical protein
MASLQSGLVLQDGESLRLEIKANLVVTSPFLPLRFVLEVIRHATLILGFRKEGYLVITNKRVSEIYRQRFLWFFYARKTVNNIRLYNIKEVDYTRKGTFAFFFRRFHLYYDRQFTRVYGILTGIGEEATQKAVNTFFTAISQA